MNDLVADSLIRIKNGYLSQKDEVLLPYSKLVASICKVLEKENYLEKSQVLKDDKAPNIQKILVTLKYDSQSDSSNKKEPVLRDVQRISKPGLRIYKGNKALPRVLNGLGIAIISTPKGVMTDKDARKEGVGGEVLAYVW